MIQHISQKIRKYLFWKTCFLQIDSLQEGSSLCGTEIQMSYAGNWSFVSHVLMFSVWKLALMDKSMREKTAMQNMG